MDPLTRLLMQGAAGAGGAGLGIEEIFSTWLYTGNSSTQTITNGIDLAGEGGMVWTKNRPFAVSHALYDTERGATKFLSSNATTAEVTASTSLTSFNSDGFTLGADGSYGYSNFAGYGNYASWTFRKAPGFFDVVTWTGDGTGPRSISHNLGGVPGCIIVKMTSFVEGLGDWYVYHRGVPSANNYYLQLNTTSAVVNAGSNIWSPTASAFLASSYLGLNLSGQTYVAYLFAHDEQIFGEGGDQSVIKCDSVTMPSSGTWQSVNLGWEPQWLLVKNTDLAGTNWEIYDNMRGVTTGGNDAQLLPNSTAAEYLTNNIEFTATGFNLLVGWYGTNRPVAYIAIRRGPMKTPTSGTEVFSAIAATASTSTTRTTGFPVDLQIGKDRSSVALAGSFFSDRLRGVSTNTTAFGAILYSSSTAAESTTALTLGFDNTGFKDAAFYNTYPMAWWNFRRAPGFFDVVAYTGTGAARTVAHNLGTAPELMIIKGRSIAQDWVVYSASEGASKAGYLNTTAAFFSDSGNAWNNTSPTASVFTVNVYSSLNGIGNTYIAYLFATLPGISKVGSYTGTGTTLNIDCGFTAGARFVLIKRTDSTGDWYVWDTARGIVSGNDPYLLLNSTAAEVTSTDYIDPLSSGFQISSTAPAAINASGGSFIFLAVA